MGEHWVGVGVVALRAQQQEAQDSIGSRCGDEPRVEGLLTLGREGPPQLKSIGTPTNLAQTRGPLSIRFEFGGSKQCLSAPSPLFWACFEDGFCSRQPPQIWGLN